MENTNATTTTPTVATKPQLTDEQLRALRMDHAYNTIGTVDASLSDSDICWLVQNDENKRSYDYWFSESLREGAKAKKRTMEYSLNAKRRASAEKKQTDNEEKFMKYLLSNPETAGDLPKLLVIATAFEIPTNIVMEIHNKANLAKQAQAATQASQVQVKPAKAA